ncbi:uncharacterized protein [Eurosta solidaginis]|uniref:uncharacterized protein isoform X2 n=1 Tax=Eurosta solidaginis TaxID=178769 RepID=UPI003530B72A
MIRKMADPSSAKRCKCCLEVMDELITMRLSFDKLRKEIIGLRRDVGEVLENKSNQNTLSKPTNTSPNPSVESTNHEETNDFYVEPLYTSDFCLSDTEEKTKKNRIKKPRQEKAKKKEKSEEINCAGTVRPVLDFFNLQARVMPTQPFRSPQQFEDWNILLRNDEDQRDQLRVELMQGNYNDPDKYIRQTWRNLFHKDAGYHFSYKHIGHNKIAIRDFIFTDIFKEVFLQRFYNMDEDFFIERTKQFFKYVRDQRRKAIYRQRKNAPAKEIETQYVDETMDGE